MGWLASRRGDDQTGIVTLAVAVGARMWLDDHGCACGPHHTRRGLMSSASAPTRRRHGRRIADIIGSSGAALPTTTVAEMPEPPTQFSFMDRLESYRGAIQELSADELVEVKQWTPTEAHGALRIRFEHGTVLIAAMGTTVPITLENVNSSPRLVIVGTSNDPCED